MKLKLVSIPVLIIFLTSSVLPAAKKKILPEMEKDNLVKTEHSMTISGEKIGYTTVTGTIFQKNEGDKKGVKIFFIYYLKKGPEKKRPLIFSFNGGPGSSSVWLHLGLLGPKRAKLHEDGSLPAPPYSLIPNNYSLLNIADLVFIDPVSTGFSRAEDEKDAKNYHGVGKDIRSVGNFIRLFLTRYNRWHSPKYLIGESYGTTRAAGLSGYLQNGLGINLNGIMLISSILNFQTTRFANGNDLPYVLFLPTYSATAWYHGKISPSKYHDLDSILKESEKFAYKDYSEALLKGDLLTADEREKIAAKLSELTGLPKDFINMKNLRVSAYDFFRELLKKEGKTVGRLDGRITGYNLVAEGKSDSGFFSDPSYFAIQGPYTSMLNDYVKKELKFSSDLNYEIITRRIKKWDIGQYYGRYVNVSDILRNSIVKNPYLKVFVAAGYFDFATPWFAAKYTFSHMNLPEKLRKNIKFEFYKAGHMMYINLESLKRLSRHLKSFINSSLPK